MSNMLQIPSSQEAETVESEVAVSTGRGVQRVEDTFRARLPKSLADAIAIHGEREVFKKFIGSLIIELQARERARLKTESERRPRRRASYLDQLDL